MSRLLGKPLRTSELPGKPDFVFPKSKLVVFVQDDFWHRCPVCRIPLPKKHRDYWKRKLDRSVERDRLNRKQLEAMGWKVLEVWEHEIRESPVTAAARVKALVG